MKSTSKKAISLFLSLVMVFSAFAMLGAISASAENYERVIINYDDLSRNIGIARREGKADINTSSITSVDGLDNPNGKVLKLVLSNNMGFNIGLTENWYVGKPIAIKFWARTESGSFASNNSHTGLSSDPNAYASDLVSIFSSNGGSLDSTGRYYTVDLSSFTLEQLKTFRYISFRTSGLSSNVIAYFDDISLVYKNESDAPAELEWKTKYDWENDTDGATEHGNKFTSSTEAFTDIGSRKCLKITCLSQNNHANYFYVDVSSGIENAKSLRVATSFNANGTSNPAYFGVEYEGTQYWKSYPYSQNSYAWLYYDFNTFTSDDGVSITLDDTNVGKVTKLLFSFSVPWLPQYVDDIQYAVEKSDGAVKASFSGADETVADVANGGTFPDASVSGYTFIGWKDSNGDLYRAGSTIAITQNTKFTAVAAKVETQDGASVRWSNDDIKRGLKFTTYITGNVDSSELIKYISPEFVKTNITGNGKTVDVMNNSANDGHSKFAVESNVQRLYFTVL